MKETIIQLFRNKYNKLGIQWMIFLSFTLSTVVVVLLVCITFYNRFSSQLDANIQEEKQILIEQVNHALDSHLRNMMKVSDSLYYNVIKNTDLDEESILENMQLIYEVNRDHILNIALFDSRGGLLEAAPPVKLKPTVDVVSANWYQASLHKTENLHFLSPTVQNLFIDTDDQYHWVLSLSRSVEITKSKKTEQGILLIDMKYTGIDQIFKNTQLGRNGYIYLIDSSGEIIYHPKQQLIASGTYKENNRKAKDYRDGIYKEVLDGERRGITVKSVGYTGWKIIGVTKEQSLYLDDFQNRVFMIFIFLLFVSILTVMNSYISTKITNPIKELEKSVLQIEREMDEDKIYVGGSYEVRHLSKTLKKMVRQMRQLMEQVVKEHESKRKTELDALQSQINPHFLYNTLDIIVWMVENEKPTEAVKVVTALARLFRISLSKGNTIISVKDELEHVKNYLMIQEMRFKNKFNHEIVIDEKTEKLTTIKLIVQPIVENSIYHGMEFMDGDGFIKVHAYCTENDLYIKIRDNGFGMRQEEAETLLKQKKISSGKGSGIGLWNIQERIQIYFGEEYGLCIESEPDEGTEITIHLPAISYEDAKEVKEAL